MAEKEILLNRQRRMLYTLFKAAVNVFHQSLGHHGPYNEEFFHNFRWPGRVVCLWPLTNCFTEVERCLIICDTAAMERLEPTLATIPIHDRGTCLPHVNLKSDSMKIEWFMMESSSASPHITVKHVWFMVSAVMQDIFEHVACLRGLVPMRSMVTCSCLNVAFTSSVQEMALTVVVMQPGNLIVSWLPSKESECADNSCLQKSTEMSLSYVADKKSLSEINRDQSLSNLIELDFHIILNGIPQSLILAISQFQQGTVKEDECNLLHHHSSEMTIKEEPAIHSSAAEHTLHTVRKETSLQCKSAANVETKRSRFETKREASTNDRQRRCSFFPYVGILLQCPKCSVSFKCGSKGQGKDRLEQHVYESHPRLTSFCTLKIRERYGEILDAVQRTGL